MNISFSPSSNSQLSNLNFNADSNKHEVAIRDKAKKRNTINNSNSSLKVTSRKNSVLKGLMKQKENLINNKNKFMENALKEGMDPKSIKEKLEEYDKQIEEIDKQISKLQLDDQRKALNTDGNDKNKKSKKTSDKTSTNEVKTDSSKDNIVALSEGLKEHKTLSHLKNKIKGNINELKADIEYDEKFTRNGASKASKELLALEETNLENVDKELSNNLKNISTKSKEKLKDNTSKNAVDKNEKSKNTNSNETINKAKLLTKRLETVENIEHYSNVQNGKIKNNGEKVDATA